MKLTAAFLAALSHFDTPPVATDPAKAPIIIVHGVQATGGDAGTAGKTSPLART